jgi:hypothetical protein
MAVAMGTARLASGWFDVPQAGRAQGDHRDAVGVDRVRRAALTGGEHPRPSGQFRRHVQDGLAVGGQALGDVPADAVAALDRPDPVFVFAGGGEHHLATVPIGAAVVPPVNK